MYRIGRPRPPGGGRKAAVMRQRRTDDGPASGGGADGRRLDGRAVARQTGGWGEAAGRTGGELASGGGADSRGAADRIRRRAILAGATVDRRSSVCRSTRPTTMPAPERLEPPFYFTKLSIENVRAFGEKQELKLADEEGRPAPWTLIVGDNGVGKTTLLQCLAWMRPRFNPPPDETGGSPANRGEPAARPIEPELAAEVDNDVLEALVRSGKETPARLEARRADGIGTADCETADSEAPARLEACLSDGVELRTQAEGRPDRLSTSFSVERADGRVTNVAPDGEPADAEAMKDVQEPFVLGYGAGRHPTVGAEMNAVATGPVESLFGVKAGLHDAEERLQLLDYSSLKGDSKATQQLGSLKKAIVAMLPDVRDPGDIEIGLQRERSDPSRPVGVHVETPYGKVPLDRVSLGYRTMFAWIVDIAWRLLDRYPESTTPLHEPAIVLVDEIDLHLHPRWQRDIRKTLVEHFPRVQFITTAHSPLMAQSALDANLAVVRRSGDRAEIVNDPLVIKEWRLDQLVTSVLFGLDSARSPVVAEKRRRRAELLMKSALSPAERDELNDLNEWALEMPTAESSGDDEAMAIIRRAAAELRSRGETP